MSWQDDAIPGHDPDAAAPAPIKTLGGLDAVKAESARVSPTHAVQAQRDAEGAQVVASADNPDVRAPASIASGGANDMTALRTAIARETARGPKAAKSVATLNDVLSQKPAAPDDSAAPAAAPAAAPDAAAPTWMSQAIPGQDDGAWAAPNTSAAIPTDPSVHAPAPLNDMQQRVAALKANPPTIGDKVIGGIEAGMQAITSIVNYPIGVASGVVRNVATAAGEGVGAGVTAVSRAARGVPQSLPNDPHIGDASTNLLNGPDMQAVVAQPQTLMGKDYAEDYVDPTFNALGSLVGHGHEVMQAHGAVAPVIQAVGDIAGRGGAAAAKGVAKVVGVDPELAKVAQIAHELPYPIAVRPDQVVGNAKFSRLAGQASSDVPLSGSKNEPNQIAFTKNAINLINPDERADRLTPEIYADAMNRSGQGIGDIAAKTPVPLEDINDQLEALRDHVNAKHSDETTKPINAYIDELQAKADDNGMIDGTALKNINSEIGERAHQEADKPLGGQLNDLQSIIQDGVEKNIADPADLKALKDYRRQYAYGKLLQPTVAKTITGLVSPASLMNAVTRTNLGKSLMANAKGGPIGDLAKVGQLIKEPGSSNTTERGLVYGAGLGGAAYVEPHTAAAAYGAANLYNRAGPALTKAIVGKRPKPFVPGPEEPPPEPTTSPGAGGGGGGPPAPEPGPLGDLTPEWGTTPGAGGGPPRGGHEPGLVPAVGETPPTTGNRKTQPQMPVVPGRPDLPDTMTTGGPAESAATEGANAAMNEPGAIEARRQQAAKPEAAQAPAQGPSIAEAQRMLAENPSPEARKILEDHIEAAKQVARDRAAQEAQDAKAAQLERTARETTDPVIQKKLLAEADKLRGTERIPVGATKEGQPGIPSDVPTKPLPAGKTIEGEPTPEKVPAGNATEREMTPEEEKSWRTQFGLGADDAQRAKDVAQALKHDAPAVEAAAVQHEKSPRAFDRAIADINEKGEASANEAKPAAEGSEGNANDGAAGTAGGAVRQDGGAEAVRAGETGGAEAGAGRGAVPATDAGAGANAKPEPAAAVRGADEQPGANGVPEAGRGGVSAAGEGGQGASEQEGAGGVGERVRAATKPISHDEALKLVAGKTEKPGGVDPSRMLGASVDNGRELRHGDVPLDAIRANGEGARYDGTVDMRRAAEYAERGDEMPPVLLVEGRDGSFNVNDGGHRVTAARLRGDETIPAIVGMRKAAGGAGVKGPEQQTEAEFGAPRKAAHIEELMNELAEVNGKPAASSDFGKFSKYKTRTDATRQIVAEMQKARAADPVKYASDHLAEINKAIREGKTPSAENVKRYQLEQPDDTAKQPGAAGDLQRGQEAQAGEKGRGKEGAQEPDQNGVGAPEAGVGPVAPTPFGNAKAMDKFIREQGGDKLIDGLRNRGLLKYSNSIADSNPRAGAIMRQPNYPDLENHANTAATLYYDKLHEGNVMGVLMHELGEHFGIERVLGTSRYLAMLSDLKSLKETPEVAEAWAHVEKNYVGEGTVTNYKSMDDVNAVREVAARLVETHPDLPFVRRLISEIRAFFYEHFGTTLGNTVDADLIRGLAASALRKAGEGKLAGQKPLVPRSTAPPPRPFVPKTTPRSDGFPPLYQ